jgi:hypothetical protein
LDDYLKYKPTEFDEEDIYVCEYRYLGRKLHFKRFNTWPYPEEIDDLAKEDRPEDFNPQKTMSSEFISREVTCYSLSIVIFVLRTRWRLSRKHIPLMMMT